MADDSASSPPPDDPAASPPPDQPGGEAESPVPFSFDADLAARLFREEPSLGMTFMVEQVEQQAGARLPAPLRSWMVDRFPQAMFDADKRPAPYDSTGLGFLGEILLCLLDAVERELLPAEASPTAKEALGKITSVLRRAMDWTAGRSPAEINAALESGPLMRLGLPSPDEIENIPADDPAAAALVAGQAAVGAVAALVRLQELGLPTIEELHEPAMALGLAPAPPAPRRKRRLPAPLPDYVPFTADRVEQGMHEAICCIRDWRRDVAVLDRAGRQVAFAHASESRSDRFRLLIGYPAAADAMVEALAGNDTLALKLMHVLWGRWFDQAGGDPNLWARVEFGQLCSDLGLTRNKGAFRPQHKGQVADVYEAITGLELYAEYMLPGSNGMYALRGKLWDRGVDAIREGGSVGVTSEVYWRPGPIFADPRWRPANRYLGHLDRRLLQLDRRERWAIRLGADYAMLARRQRDTPEFQQRQEVIERVRRVLQRTGLARGYGEEPAKQQPAFLDAHDQLVEVGVLVDHRYGDRGAPDWRSRDLVLRFPRELLELPGQLPMPLDA